MVAYGFCQFSMTNPGTRLNSEVLWVTSVQLFAKAMAAIYRSEGEVDPKNWTSINVIKRG